MPPSHATHLESKLSPGHATRMLSPGHATRMLSPGHITHLKSKLDLDTLALTVALPQSTNLSTKAQATPQATPIINLNTKHDPGSGQDQSPN